MKTTEIENCLYYKSVAGPGCDECFTGFVEKSVYDTTSSTYKPKCINEKYTKF